MFYIIQIVEGDLFMAQQIEGAVGKESREIMRNHEKSYIPSILPILFLSFLHAASPIESLHHQSFKTH
jgi:hypothetical protein